MKVPLQGHVHVRISGSSFHVQPISDVAASRVYVLVLTTVGHTFVSIIFVMFNAQLYTVCSICEEVFPSSSSSIAQHGPSMVFLWTDSPPQVDETFVMSSGRA